MRILLVDDEESLAHTIMDFLSQDNHLVDVTHSGQEAQDYIEVYPYDLILLDVGLPDGDGIQLCQRLRSEGFDQPILLLTAHDSREIKIRGLDAGADDYLVKPVDLSELGARIRALLRRGTLAQQPLLSWGDLSLDPISCEVSYQGELIPVTPKEYALLELFLRNPKRVFSQGAILEHLWTFDDPPGKGTVRAHVKGLRQKLKAKSAPDVIETVYGLGYRLRPEVQDSASDQTRAATATSESTSSPSQPVESNGSQQAKQQQTQAALAQAWEKFKPKHLSRWQSLQQALQAAQQQELTPELQQEAQQQAHRLAGSLGTYGRMAASETARQIEHLLQDHDPLGEEALGQFADQVAILKQMIEAPADSITKDTPQSQQVLLFTPDSNWGNGLKTEVNSQGIQMQSVSDLGSLQQAIQSERPDAVIWDLQSETLDTTEATQLLHQLAEQDPPIALVILTEQDQLQQRLEIARSGRHILLTQPSSPQQVLQALAQLIPVSDPQSVKVLVVDDDTTLLASVQSLLIQWGIQVIPLEDPHRFWDVLTHARPDLVVLDVEMPQISGLDLCQVVRNDMEWSWIPILFLTAYSDTDTIHQVFAAGGDDFITKPVVGPELLTRILNRLERTQLLRRLQLELEEIKRSQPAASN